MPMVEVYKIVRFISLFVDYITASMYYLKESTNISESIRKIVNIVCIRDRKMVFPNIFDPKKYSSTLHTESYGQKHPLLHYLYTSRIWNPKTEFDIAYLRSSANTSGHRRSLMIHYLRHFKDKSLCVRTSKPGLLKSFQQPQNIHFLPGNNVDTFSKKIHIEINSCKNLSVSYKSELYSPKISILQTSHSDALCAQLSTEELSTEFDLDTIRILFMCHQEFSLDVTLTVSLIIHFFEFQAQLHKLDSKSLSVYLLKNLKWYDFLSKNKKLNHSTPALSEKLLRNFVDNRQQVLPLEEFIFDQKKLSLTIRKLIVFIHEDSRTGAPMFGNFLAEQLRKSGIDVLIMVQERTQGKSIFHKSAHQVIFLEDLLEKGQHFQENWILSPSALAAVGSAVKDFSPDLVILNSLATVSIMDALKFLCIPTACYVHEAWGNVIDIHESEDPFIKTIINTLSTSQLVVFGSDFSAEVWGPIPKFESKVIPSIIPYDDNSSPNLNIRATVRKSLGITEHSLVFLGVATFEPRKRIEDSIKAFLTADIPGSSLILVGKNKIFKNYVNEITEQIKNAKNIYVLDVVENLTPFFLASDIFLHSSQEEVFPLIVQEAFSFSLPVIAASYNGIQALVGKEYPYLFEPKNIEAAVASITTVVTQIEEARKLSKHLHEELLLRFTANNLQLVNCLNSLTQVSYFNYD